jgi:hypothetical protein
MHLIESQPSGGACPPWPERRVRMSSDGHCPQADIRIAAFMTNNAKIASPDSSKPLQPVPT